jgi:decaprenylphospho-beta-D-erythro-pentofuranosid-2-ulose 2-reductase
MGSIGRGTGCGDQFGILEAGKQVSMDLIVGASSAIGLALARRWAARGRGLLLTGRDGGRLDIVARDLECRGAAEVRTLELDLDDPDAGSRFRVWLGEQPEALSRAVIAPGVLSLEEGSWHEWRRDVNVNFVGPAYCAREVMDRMASQAEGGHLVLVGSVAGDRGRGSNGFYGAQKAAVECYAQALRHRAFSMEGVEVSLVKPGQVRSAMTSHLAESSLFADAAEVSRRIDGHVERGRGGVIYAPRYWRWVMMMVRSLPTYIFHRTKL